MINLLIKIGSKVESIFNTHSLEGLAFKFLNSRVTHVLHNDIRIVFHTPNWITRYRAKTFSSKEPETLKWIDGFKENSVFWDIGANVGLYSLYAAKLGSNVVCFEPSVFNLEMLAKNIFINNVAERIAIFPLPLSDKIYSSRFNMVNPTHGSALSTFRESYGYDGSDMNANFFFNTYSISLDKVRETFDLTYPDYIKLDVDGIEHLILSGASNVLSKAKQILVEVSPKFAKQERECFECLANSGFKINSITGDRVSTQNVIFSK
jgi:FkbM family methyltransferase